MPKHRESEVPCRLISIVSPELPPLVTVTYMPAGAPGANG